MSEIRLCLRRDAEAEGLGYGVVDDERRAFWAKRDARPLTEHRALTAYLYGTCHDFALLAVSALRERGIPARLRVGFASYFRADHWVCEHRCSGHWAILDAQAWVVSRGMV